MTTPTTPAPTQKEGDLAFIRCRLMRKAKDVRPGHPWDQWIVQLVDKHGRDLEGEPPVWVAMDATVTVQEARAIARGR